MRYVILLCFCNLFLVANVAAQNLFIAGPMPGYTELRTARIWTEVGPQVKKASISWWPSGVARAQAHAQTYKDDLQQDFNPIVFTLNGLKSGTPYDYEITATDGKQTDKQVGSFTTQELWNYRKPAPDFSFLTGSCSYTNEPEYDRPGTPYGGDSSIFNSMAKTDANFMLWLGDNWYTREADYYSPWGLMYRAHHDRSAPILQPLLKAMPHYAIWDDHDFGPNDFGASYIYKEQSRETFSRYWANPTYGQEGKGIYTQFAYNDVAFFLLDDRTWRSSDAWKDSVDGAPDPAKRMLGKTQMQWLKDALLQSRQSTFKIIAVGSQVLNPASPFDCFRHFELEFAELMDFLEVYKIPGVVFLTGDRHHSEVISMPRKSAYTLYDVTVSPLTSHVYAPGGVEKDMKERVAGTGVNEQNFARISISGAKGKRVLQVSYRNLRGEEVATWQIGEEALK